MDLYDRYVNMVSEILTTIYADMIKYYPNERAVRKEIFNISRDALKPFNAIDSFEDKINELFFLFDNCSPEEKPKIKHKLDVLNNALKIINEDDKAVDKNGE